MSVLKKNLLQNGIWCCIIYDGHDFSDRPFDMLIRINNKILSDTVAVEGKFQKDFSAFGMSKIRESQIKNLDKYEKENGLAFIFLNIWMPRKENRLIIWEWGEFKKITKNGSIKKKELTETPFIKINYESFQVDRIVEKITCYRDLSFL